MVAVQPLWIVTETHRYIWLYKMVIADRYNRTIKSKWIFILGQYGVAEMFVVNGISVSVANANGDSPLFLGVSKGSKSNRISQSKEIEMHLHSMCSQHF